MKVHASAACMLAGALCVPSVSDAFQIDVTDSALDLTNALFLNFDQLVLTGPPSAPAPMLSGAFGQAGLYTNPTGTYGMPAQGIVLSTGNVLDYQAGPNEDSGTTTAYCTNCEDDFDEAPVAVAVAAVEGVDIDPFAPDNAATPEQEAILGPITGVDQHFDVVQLSINFFAQGPSSVVTFFAAFGSEEYPEYVNEELNDGFGLLVNGVNYASTAGAPINIDNPLMAPIPGTELDGVLAPAGNPVLRFDVPVNLGEINTFDVILADAGDSIVDTTVYLTSFFADPGSGGAGPTGASEFDPLLPVNGAVDPVTGAFEILLPEALDPAETIWIDPPVTIGYTYEVTGGALFDSIVAPSLATVPDTDGYILTIAGSTFTLAPGATFTFGTPVAMFQLTGIDPALMLDPLDPLAFPIGISLDSVTAAGASVSVSPLISAIPLPSGAPLYLGALALSGWILRRRRAPRA